MRLRSGVSLLFMLLGFATARALEFPDKPIRLLAPFPAGSLSDLLARARAARPTNRSITNSIYLLPCSTVPLLQLMFHLGARYTPSACLEACKYSRSFNFPRNATTT